MYHQDVVDDNVYKWNLILLYGSPYIGSRSEVWELISHYLDQNSLDSVIMGEFNQIEFLNKKWGAQIIFQERNNFPYGKVNWGYQKSASMGKTLHGAITDLKRNGSMEDWIERM